MRRLVALFLLAIGSAMQPQAANNTQKDMFASIGEREPGR